MRKALPLLLLLPFLLAAAPSATPVAPDLRFIDDWGEHARAARVMLILFQVAAILAAAKLLGALAEKVKVPGVIGELLAGVLIGPFALGAMVHLPLLGHSAPLFPPPASPNEWPVNDVVWLLAQFASIILLFVTGLHTDLRQFLKYVGPATLIAVVGLVVPFALGVGVVYLPPFSKLAGAGESPLVPALFVGAILAATSIGITARVLGDIGKLDTPEGVTILGAAVLDDVLGIIALAIVGGIASAGAAGAAGVSFAAVGLVAGKAFGFWIGLTVVTMLLAGPIERALTGIKYGGAMAGLGLALAFVCSALAESFGLAFIIGAYSVGLGLSRTKMAHTLMDRLQPVADFFVPIFFASLGMLVNVQVMLKSWEVIGFGLAVTAAAVVGKLVGCGLAALPVGFNSRGAYRIGLGMLPRGEVALIVAGIGLSRQIVGEVVFGVSIMMTLITTIVAPILLVPAFARGGGGRRAGEGIDRRRLPTESPEPAFEVRTPTVLAGDFIELFLDAARRAGWEASYEKADEDIYLLRSGNDAAQLTAADGSIRIDASAPRRAEMLSIVESVRREMIRCAEGVSVEPKR